MYHVNSIRKNYFNTHVPTFKILFGLVVKLGKNLHEDDLKSYIRRIFKNKSDFILRF